MGVWSPISRRGLQVGCGMWLIFGVEAYVVFLEDQEDIENFIDDIMPFLSKGECTIGHVNETTFIIFAGEGHYTPQLKKLVSKYGGHEIHVYTNLEPVL